MAMINYIFNQNKIRIDTTITIIDADGTKHTAPTIVIVKIDGLNPKHEANFWRLSKSLFDKEFVIDKRPKETAKKEKWYKFW